MTVRTPAFKKWFGNWEAKAQWNKVQSTQPLKMSDAEVSYGEAKKLYADIEQSKANMYDGIKVQFVANAFQKVQGHKNATLINRCVPIINDLFERAVPIYVERERNPTKSSNIVGFHNYLTRTTDGNNVYYVRFTAQELTPSSKRHEKKGKAELHNLALSNIEVYSEKDINEARKPTVSSGLDSGDLVLSSFLDKKIAEWLNDVKSNEVSGIVDENGEPKVVYHSGTFGEEGNAVAKGAVHFGTLEAAKERIYIKEMDDRISEGLEVYQNDDGKW